MDMIDYKQMYKRMFQEMTKAILTLQEVQRECEEMYISAEDTKLTVLPNPSMEQTEQ